MKSKLPQIDGVSVHCAHQKIVPVGKLKPYPRNNKIHPDAQIDLLCKAIKAQGWRAPVTVSIQSGYIVRGHARLEAAKRLGLKAVPVDCQNYATPEAERLDRIADNKLAELAEWDLGNLKEELIELDAGDLDLDLSGFNADELEDLMTQCVPEIKEPKEKDCGPEMPFGLVWGPCIVRRKGNAVIACCKYNGEKEIVDKIKAWKNKGDNKSNDTTLSARAIVKLIKEIGLYTDLITTPQRHHEGWHAASSISSVVAKSIGVQFRDVFGFKKENSGHHPARNTEREKPKLSKLKSRAVLIIDDVATSGETLWMAANSIREAKICAVSIALVYYWP